MDYTLVLAAMVVIALGLVTIASATQATSVPGEGNFKFVYKQLMGIALGTAAFIFFLLWRYEELIKYAKVLYGANLVMLTAVLLIGHSVKGAQRWIQIGPLLLQPSEFAKLAVIIGLAAFLSQRDIRLDRLRDLVPAFAYVGVPTLLILTQPDLGTALVFVAITVGMLYIAGARPLLLGSLLVGGLGSAIAWIWAHLNYGIWIPLKDYQITRLTIFLDPWSDWLGAGYNMIQSQIAIGAGGLWGRGLFNGSQNQRHFLPEQHTDFIFSVLAEELGFIGVILVLSIYFVLVYRGLRIAGQAKDLFGTLLATGIVSMLVFHVLTNVGMTAGIMPVTGLPLPMFSYGPSSMITNLAALGLLSNIWLRRQQIVF